MTKTRTTAALIATSVLGLIGGQVTYAVSASASTATAASPGTHGTRAPVRAGSATVQWPESCTDLNLEDVNDAGTAPSGHCLRTRNGRIIHLQAPEGSDVWAAKRISRHGRVLGFVMSYGFAKPVVWESATAAPTQLPEPPGVGPYSEAQLLGISDTQVLARWYDSLGGEDNSTPLTWLWQHGAWTPIQTYTRGALLDADFLNEQGMLARTSFPYFQLPAAIWRGGRLTFLSGPGGCPFPELRALADDGTAAGSCGDPLTWDRKGRVHVLPMPAGFTQVVVTGAARHDYVVGYVSRNVCLPDGTCPLVTEGVGWHRGRVELFGQVDAIPFAVNSKGLVVGGGSVWQFSAARR